MTLRSRLTTIALVTLAALTLGLSALALVALKGGGEARIGSVALLKIAAGYDRRAEPMLAAPSVPPPAIRREAAGLSRAATRQFPYDASAWLRLAYVDALEHGGLTPQGVAWLQRSYDLVAIDPQIGVWRVGFALENSQALSPSLRSTVRKEAAALWLIGAKRNELRQMANTIGNPAGRLSLRLWLNRLETAVAK